MSGPFAPGDVVVCVDDSPRRGVEALVKIGKLYRISEVEEEPCQRGEFALRFYNAPAPDPWWGYNAKRFRHLPKADPAFTEAMRAIKPIRKEVDA